MDKIVSMVELSLELMATVIVIVQMLLDGLEIIVK